jgi:Ca2+-binding EF-hand superfamily protein
MKGKVSQPQSNSKPLAASVVKGSISKTKKDVPTTWKDRISPEDYEHLRDVYLLFDEDGSGTIDPQEIVKVLEEIGLDKRNPNVIKIVLAMR